MVRSSPKPRDHIAHENHLMSVDTEKPDLTKIKAVLFDKDGTLLEFNRTWGPATAAVIARLADDQPRVMAELAGSVGFLLGDQDFEADSILLGGYTADYAEDWARILKQRPDQGFIEMVDRLYGLYSVKHARAFPDADLSLTRMQQAGLPLGIATNDSEANARAHAEAISLAEHMTLIMGYDSGHGGKPGPGMIIAFADHLGLEVSDIAMVGDTLHDIYAARHAGALAIGISTGTFGADPLREDAQLIVASLSELADHLCATRS